MNECITPYNLCFVCLILLEYISLPSPFVFSHPNAGLEVTSIPIVSHCHVSRFISMALLPPYRESLLTSFADSLQIIYMPNF